jgi:hypothetical protein
MACGSDDWGIVVLGDVLDGAVLGVVTLGVVMRV